MQTFHILFFQCQLTISPFLVRKKLNNNINNNNDDDDENSNNNNSIKVPGWHPARDSYAS